MTDFSQMSDEELEALYNAELAKASGKAPPKLTGKLQEAETADIEAIQASSQISGQVGRYKSQVESGQLNLGPVQNVWSDVKNFAGKSDPNSRNYGSFRAGLEKLRNDSLRLNKGMQTEGDAQRAWNELLANVNDESLVQQRLAEIDGINRRAIDNRRAIVSQRRSSQNVGPADLTEVERGSIRAPYDLSKGETRQAIPLGSFYTDPYRNTRRNDNYDAGNPKFDAKTGAQIKDEGRKPTNALTGKGRGKPTDKLDSILFGK